MLKNINSGNTVELTNQFRKLLANDLNPLLLCTSSRARMTLYTVTAIVPHKRLQKTAIKTPDVQDTCPNRQHSLQTMTSLTPVTTTVAPHRPNITLPLAIKLVHTIL